MWFYPIIYFKSPEQRNQLETLRKVLRTGHYNFDDPVRFWLLPNSGFPNFCKISAIVPATVQTGCEWHTSKRSLKSLWRVAFTSLKMKHYKLCELSIKNLMYWNAVLSADLRWLRKQTRKQHKCNLHFVIRIFFHASLNPGAA